MIETSSLAEFANINLNRFFKFCVAKTLVPFTKGALLDQDQIYVISQSAYCISAATDLKNKSNFECAKSASVGHGCLGFIKGPGDKDIKTRHFSNLHIFAVQHQVVCFL